MNDSTLIRNKAGRQPPQPGDAQGLPQLRAAYWNLRPPRLYEEAIRRGEAKLTAGGALVVETGQHTGRSAKDKFILREAETEDRIWWDNNGAISRPAFDRLHADMLRHAAGKELFAQDLHAGADPAHRVKARVYTEFAWHSLFIRNLLIRADQVEPSSFVPDLTILDLPSFRAEPAKYGIRSETVIACDLAQGIVLIAGTSYAGEIKKSVFTFLNYHLPARGVMPMHCSVNVGAQDDAAIFFGLSGTGKTTLSACAERVLIGDDEHGWGPDGLFNFEGGCYAKTIKLSPEAEPQIFAAADRFGTVLENVVIDPLTRRPDYDDARLTENTRAAYPLSFIANASPTGRAGHPKNIVMLTADAFGVLPPIAKLTPAQAIYHFLSGFTAKVAGTEKGVAEPQPTFSACFGAPFMPRHPAEYGNLLRELIDRHQANCWLVNTGWTGGSYGIGRRMPIQSTRTLLNAALDGSLTAAPFRKDRYFGFSVPRALAGVDADILDPSETWSDKAAYDQEARKLIDMFVANFAKFEPLVDDSIKTSSPRAASPNPT
jgi:phosphoenolpyruvate carboxykinase (ATP)